MPRRPDWSLLERGLGGRERGAGVLTDPKDETDTR